MVNISFEKITSENINASNNELTTAKRTVHNLIRVHQNMLAQIEAGERFTKGPKDITDQIWTASLDEIDQCRKVLEALNRMGAGDIKQANYLLSQIQEFIPHEH